MVTVRAEEDGMPENEASDVEIATGLAHAPSPFLFRVLNRLSRVQRERDFLLLMLRRIRCGCFAADCTVHGAYASDDIERSDKLFGEAASGRTGQ